MASITRRCSVCPLDDVTSRRSMTAASHATSTRSACRSNGWTRNRTHGSPPRVSTLIPWAWSDDVRAPVSTFALTTGSPSSGNASHSRQP